MADRAMAEMMRPAWRGERASTSWSFWVLSSSRPARPNMAPPAVRAPPLKMREPKMSKVSRGSDKRAWRRPKASAPQMKTMPAAALTGQLCARDLMASTRLARVIREYRDEGKSQCFRGFGAFGGARNKVSTMVTTTTGTLSKKTEPHQKCSKKKPPTVGPAAAPMTATEPQMPMAVLRSTSSGKVRRISARLDGIMMAAPQPKKARPKTSVQALGEYAASREAPPKTAKPMRNIRRWPVRSPSVPAPRRRPESTNA